MASLLTFTVSYVALLALSVLSSLVDGYCYFHAECSIHQKYCCKGSKYSGSTNEFGYCRDSCVGLPCYYESDCAPSETCCDSDNQCRSGDCEDSDNQCKSGDCEDSDNNASAA